MPTIEFSRVVSCSSEDKSFPAENLLSPENFKKWKGCPGEERVIVVLEMRKAERIESLQIGNETSAFVEVQVGRAVSDPDDYKVLLPASAFMSPKESHQLDHTNRVRIFPKLSLSSKVADQPWDRVKVICTQPFNRSVGYGLSFIRLQSPEEGGTQQQHVSARSAEVGNVLLEGDNVPKETTDSAGRFEQWRSGHKLTVTDSENGIVVKVASGHEKVESNQPERNSTAKSSVEHTASPKRPAEDDILGQSTSGAKKRKKAVPFSSLLEGVTLVLSGFVNPLRAELRERALNMGAKYRANWDDQCTHLVCAFRNTPKYREVFGKGLIVKKEWIFDCFKEKKKLPLRRYLFDTTGYKSSDDEAESDQPGVTHPSSSSSPEVPAAIEGFSEEPSQEVSTSNAAETDDSNGGNSDDIYNRTTDDESPAASD